MRKPFHMNCGKLVKCDECQLYDVYEDMIQRGFTPRMARSVIYAGMYGMGERKLARLLGEDPARNLADAYRPEGLP